MITNLPLLCGDDNVEMSLIDDLAYAKVEESVRLKPASAEEDIEIEDDSVLVKVLLVYIDLWVRRTHQAKVVGRYPLVVGIAFFGSVENDLGGCSGDDAEDPRWRPRMLMPRKERSLRNPRLQGMVLI